MDILKVQGETFSRVSEQVSEEVPLTIEVNGIEAATLLCSPDHLKDLVTGFLFTSGLVPGLSALKSLVIDQERFRAAVEIDGDVSEFVFKRVYTSGCGKGVIFHNPMDVMNKTRLEEGFTLKASMITGLMKDFIKGSDEHTRTRGVHSGALAIRERILIFRDDIGRHNALDKVIGQALYQDLDFTGMIMLTTGRISSEILSKVLRCRIPVIAALGSPTNQAIKLARVADLTLVSHVRGSRMDLYSGEARVLFNT
ncbi:MAG TPA: formate dehydrogenase accessory sulfurtransferase FdhD [Desulfomonilia bacterium]|nr:formate dehydrogenase accessory sulfurtransferase FdhD [Desulfomonilia bacterium]